MKCGKGMNCGGEGGKGRKERRKGMDVCVTLGRCAGGEGRRNGKGRRMSP